MTYYRTPVQFAVACAGVLTCVASTAQVLPTVPPGFRVEVVTTALTNTAIADIAVVPVGFGVLGGQILLCDRGVSSNFADGRLLLTDPANGNVSVFVDSTGIPDPSGFAFAPAGTFGALLYVNNGVVLPVNQNLGAVYSVDALGNAAWFGQPNPPGYNWGGMDVAFDPASAFGGDLFTGSASGAPGDCVSRLSASGGQAALFHNVGSGWFSGSPNGFAFGHGTGGFGTDLYFSLHRASGVGPATGVYVLDPAGARTTLALATGAGGVPAVFGRLAFGPGGTFGTDLYSGSSDGLVVLDAAGNVTTFATFASFGGWVGPVAFDGADAAYFIDPAQDVLFRVLPIDAECATYGAGCAGPGASLALLCSAPVIGTNWTLTTSNIDPISPIAITFFGDAVVDPGLPLTVLGLDAPGCSMHTNTILAQLTGANVGGSAIVTVPVPNDVLLAGAELTAQSLCLTFTNNANLLTSNGVLGTLGN